MVLLVMDTQILLVNNKLYNFEGFTYNIKKLINIARENNVEVLYILHDDGVYSELTSGLEGFEVYRDFRPKDKEKVFIKSLNSAFKDTSLLDYLRAKNENDIIIVGLQTDKCIDATIKAGFEHGFNMIVPSDTNSTVNNEFLSAEQSYKYYNEYLWNGRYAKCISIDEVIRLLNN